MLGQYLKLLAAAAENKGVAALEAHHIPAGQSMIHQDLIDLLLGVGVLAAAPFAGIDEFSLPGHVPQQLGAGEIVVDHHFGPG